MKFIKIFEEIGINDIPFVGGKNASLGEMISKLTPKGILIPSGFAITAEAYFYHLKHNKLDEKIAALLACVDKKNLDDLAHIGHEIRSIIRTAPLPDDLVEDIKAAYGLMEKKYGKGCDVAVRSSATAEDLPDASFAGQQETFLNIRGEAELLRVCPDAYASLFTNRAISYRIDKGFDHMSVALSIGVQKMVRSDMASAGVIFTLDTESGFSNAILITSSYGLGENVVKGSVNPDEFYVHKQTLAQGFKPILKKRVGLKQVKMIYSDEGSASTRNIATTREERRLFSLEDDEIISLAKQALIIENHYSEQKGSWCPMDIEWAKDGLDGKIYIVQARPETVHAQQKSVNHIEEFILNKQALSKHKVIIAGKSIGKKIVSGKACLINSPKQIGLVSEGSILVTEMTDPDWEPVMKIASGIITNRGGRTCHAAIISRELGIPAIVGTGDGTVKIKNGQIVTLDCSNGEVGKVYDGEIPFEVKNIELTGIKKPPVEVMLNIGNPDEAFNLARLPHDGVGLVRIEFIINSTIQVHPMALVHFEKVLDLEERKTIEYITYGYNDKKTFFVDKLAQEVGTIAAAFYPKPVIVRFSDFKSNEYRELLAGRYFEPKEENPMIGFRGAYRYCHERYKDVFELECAAIKKMRNEMGLVNVKVMIPFVRTITESKKVIDIMRACGLIQGENGLEIYMMVEVPSGVLLIDEFSKIFDGFSIGSNDLTQMTLAVDRDSEIVSSVFDERDPSVKLLLEMAIKGAKRNKKKIGICGQAPSDYPELAQFLIDCGIDSISLTPDAFLRGLLVLAEKKK